MANQSLVVQCPDRALPVAISGTRPSTNSDGADLASWRTNGSYRPSACLVCLSGTVAATIGAPTGGTAGAEVWGFASGQWWLLATLNGGAAIPIASATLGAAFKLDVLGFDRLCVAGTASAGAATAKLIPLEVVV